MKIPFCKMSGCGNDFIIIDNRKNILLDIDIKKFIVSVCKRKLSVGADGIIFIESSDKADFKWHFYNSDASKASMCGNGARCISKYAFLKGICSKNLQFETDLGIVKAEVNPESVKILFPLSGKIIQNVEIDSDIPELCIINTGVPHAIINTDNLEKAPIVKLGKRIRFHKHFQPDGTNVNFFKYLNDNNISIRTYERGVEDETLACGTGAIACALYSAIKYKLNSPVNVLTKGGQVLIVYFKIQDDTFSNIFIEGDAKIIYEGILWEEGI